MSFIISSKAGPRSNPCSWASCARTIPIAYRLANCLRADSGISGWMAFTTASNSEREMVVSQGAASALVVLFSACGLLQSPWMVITAGLEVDLAAAWKPLLDAIGDCALAWVEELAVLVAG